MSNTFIQEAFKNSYLLEDAEEFSLNVSGPDDTESFLDVINAEDENEMISDVYDLEAEAKEDLKQSYIGKVILDCNVCHSNVFFDKDEVTEDEDGNCCIDVECPYCMSNEGYTIIGEVKPYQEEEEVDLADVETEEVPDEEPLDVDEEPVEDIDAEPIEDEEEGLEESFKIKVKYPKKKLSEDVDIEYPEFNYSYELIENAIKEALSEVAKQGFDENYIEYVEYIPGNDYNYDSFEIKYTSGNTDNISDQYFGSNAFEELAYWFADSFSEELDYLKEDEDDDLEEGLKADKVKALKRSERLDGQKGLGRGKGLEASDEIRGPKYKELEESMKVVPIFTFEFDSEDEAAAFSDAFKASEFGDAYAVELVGDGTAQLFGDGTFDGDTAAAELEDIVNAFNSFKFESVTNLKECGDPEKLDECGETDKLEEGIEDVQVTTEDETMTMSTKEDGGVVIETSPKEEEFVEDEFIEEPIEEEPIEGGEEMIAPIEPETEAEIEDVIAPEDEVSEEDIEFDIPEEDELGDFEEFDEESFDNLGESYLKRCYENVTSFKTSNISLNENKEFVIEGKIGFDSGNEKNTQFIFSPKANENGKLKLEGYNKQISKGKKTFKLNCSINDKALICESMNYNYKGKNDLNESVRVYGTVKRRK